MFGSLRVFGVFIIISDPNLIISFCGPTILCPTTCSMPQSAFWCRVEQTHSYGPHWKSYLKTCVLSTTNCKLLFHDENIGIVWWNQFLSGFFMITTTHFYNTFSIENNKTVWRNVFSVCVPEQMCNSLGLSSLGDSFSLFASKQAFEFSRISVWG